MNQAKLTSYVNIKLREYFESLCKFYFGCMSKLCINRKRIQEQECPCYLVWLFLILHDFSKVFGSNSYFICYVLNITYVQPRGFQIVGGDFHCQVFKSSKMVEELEDDMIDVTACLFGPWFLVAHIQLKQDSNFKFVCTSFS